MDVFSAIIVMVPLITPWPPSFDRPGELGVIFLAKPEGGIPDAPVGMNLASRRTDSSNR